MLRTWEISNGWLERKEKVIRKQEEHALHWSGLVIYCFALVRNIWGLEKHHPEQDFRHGIDSGKGATETHSDAHVHLMLK